MNTSEAIISHIIGKYNPEAMIIYGSFADGSEGEHSDFDALVIAEGRKSHDSSVIGNTVLDVFIYPPETFQSPYDPADFVQIFDGNIYLDKHGTAERLKASVLSYLDGIPDKTAEEIRLETDWCRKMLARSSRGDPEGFYRWHWLLYDSLEIYFHIRRRRYHGPKKALKFMADDDAEGYRIYTRALTEFSYPSLREWIDYIVNTAIC